MASRLHLAPERGGVAVVSAEDLDLLDSWSDVEERLDLGCRGGVGPQRGSWRAQSAMLLTAVYLGYLSRLFISAIYLLRGEQPLVHLEQRALQLGCGDLRRFTPRSARKIAEINE